ncbi:hypothetical protein [Cesiribacter sp. SM1]|uniref:hypothetical protein n=1 Tax=Cesiribacter sp. SM1 TaxID=2861196 RepID=UPI001CD7AC9D|nr:hypothetical protein [Cesiribacter sp. SM1]
MKAVHIFSLLLMLCSSPVVMGQHLDYNDSLAASFREIKAATLEHRKLWDKNLYGALLFVDPASRKLWANEPDTAGLLKKEGSVYVGRLPANVNIANTAVNWSGKRWAMLMLPLPADMNSRINLLAHELFHRVQPELGFQAHSPANEHLDEMEGRLYLRLELEALKEALRAPEPSMGQEHLRNAMLFRRYRHSLYPAADSTENLLELNEGLAEYTGLMISGRSRREAEQHLLQQQQAFLQNPSYVRSFAYHTIPLWGYLLAQQNKLWNKQLNPDTRLTPFFQKSLNIPLTAVTADIVKGIAGKYGGQQIMEEEKEREIFIQQQLLEYTRRFIEEPHLVIPFQNMSISFDPANLVSLPGRGTVYPNLRATDNWGILTVTEGALISTDWSKVTLSRPGQVEKGKVSGKGWTLELKEGYKLEQDTVSQNYMVKEQ